MSTVLCCQIRPRNALISGIILATALLFFVPERATAVPGDLDASFGSSGWVTTDLGGADEARGATVTRGRITVAGVSDAGTGTFMFALARYTLDGALDEEFGNGGIVTTRIGDGDASGNAVATQPDGKVVVAGYAGASGTYDIALARYNLDGSLDTSFGDSGVVITPVGSGDDVARDVFAGEDGSITVAGSSAGVGGASLILLRYSADGRLDPSFGRGGIARTQLSGLSGAFDLSVSSDVIVVRTISGDLFRGVWYEGGRFDVRISRTLAPGLERANTIIPLTGREVAVAGVAGGRFAVAVQSYEQPGTATSADPSFGQGGMAVVDFGRESAAHGLRFLTDRSLVAVGQAGLDFAVALFEPLNEPPTPSPPATSAPTPQPSAPQASAPPAPRATPNTRFVGSDAMNRIRIEFRTDSEGLRAQGSIQTLRDIPCGGGQVVFRDQDIMFDLAIRPDGVAAGSAPSGAAITTLELRIQGATVTGTVTYTNTMTSCDTGRITFTARAS